MNEATMIMFESSKLPDRISHKFGPPCEEGSNYMLYLKLFNKEEKKEIIKQAAGSPIFFVEGSDIFKSIIYENI